MINLKNFFQDNVLENIPLSIIYNNGYYKRLGKYVVIY